MELLLCKMLPFLNAETLGAVFPFPGLPMCLNCRERLPPAYIFGLLLWQACHRCLMAMTYHLEEGLMSFCCWSLTFPEPEPLSSMCTESFCSAWAHPWLVARASVCWLPLCFPAVPVGSFSSHVHPRSNSSRAALCGLLRGAAPLVIWGCLHPTLPPLVSELFESDFQGQLQFGCTPEHPLKASSVLCCLDSLGKSLGKLIRWSDENSMSLFLIVKLPFSSSSLLLGVSLRKKIVRQTYSFPKKCGLLSWWFKGASLCKYLPPTLVWQLLCLLWTWLGESRCFYHLSSHPLVSLGFWFSEGDQAVLWEQVGPGKFLKASGHLKTLSGHSDHRAVNDVWETDWPRLRSGKIWHSNNH